MLHKSFKPAKCKTALNLAKSRIKLLKNKKEIQVKQLKRELAQLLESGQDQTARIRVEHVVREEKTMAAYELIEIYCELIVARLPIIESQKNCPLDLKEAITSLIFAAPRCGDIPELQDVRKHFSAKYGKEFVTAAIELRPECGVSRSMVEKLSVKAPDGPMKVKILTAIAEEHNIKWEPKWFKDEDPMPSIDVAKVPPMEKTSKIQMEPLHFQIADNLEQKHMHGMARSETSQSHSNASSVANEVSMFPASHPSGNFSERMAFDHSSVGRQKWNMEFKDATAAAQAAAESAELASMAARAAAELSRNSMNISIDQRNPRMKGDQGYATEQGNITECTNPRSSNENYNQSGVQYEPRRQDHRESKDIPPYPVRHDTRRQHSRDSLSTSSISKDESYLFDSPTHQEYVNEPVENPFHEENVEIENHPSSFQSQSSVIGNEHGIFSNLDAQIDKNDLDDGSFGNFNHGILDNEDWHARASYHSGFYDGKEDVILKDHEENEQEYRFDSGREIFAGMNHETSKLNIVEKASDTGGAVVFDDSGSDDDDFVFDSRETSNDFPSPGKSSPTHVSFHQENSPKNWVSQSSFSSHPPNEPDLSESFRKSPLYSKLIEPLPVAFDDSDGASSGDEKEIHSEKTEPLIRSNDYNKSDKDPRASSELIRSSYVEKGAFDSFASSKHVEENQTHADNFDRLSAYNLVDEDKPQKSPQSSTLPLHSTDHYPEIKYGTQSNPEGGMELNLGSLPGGLRNKNYWAPPYTRGPLSDASSPPRSSKAVVDDSFNAGEMTSLTRQMETTKVSEVVISQKGSIDRERPYFATLHENLHEESPKARTRYFESDGSSSEEDVPKQPVMNKTLLGAGLSRRTKATSSSRSNDPTSRPRRQMKVTKEESLSSSVTEKPSTLKGIEISRASNPSEKAPSRENSMKTPSHVHPKLPDFESLTAHLQSLRTNRQ